MAYEKKHEFWKAGRTPEAGTIGKLAWRPLIHAQAHAMLIVSSDYKYAEEGKRPYIGSKEDRLRVLEAAKDSDVVMGYNTLKTYPRGIPCRRLYIATRNPSHVDYSLLAFRNPQTQVLVRPYLPTDVLVLGGPALIEAYYQARLLHKIDLTIAPYTWENGLPWNPTFPMASMLSAHNENTGENIYDCYPLYKSVWTADDNPRVA